MSEPTVLVTGGAGFIGSHLIDTLLAEGHCVVCLDNFNDFYSPRRKRQHVEPHLDNANFTLVEADIRNRDTVLAVFEHHRPTHVAHLAAMANVRYSIERAALYAEVNVQGTVNMLDGARAVGAENFLMASTSAIYGKAPVTPFTEELAVNEPLAPYPATIKA
ncbi:MAG: GDP-mannose 4,6-dehydratase, partial [Anaerolineae bacterium]